MNSIVLAHGSGGVESSELIEGTICSIFGDLLIDSGEDAGIGTKCENLVVSTDSYVVNPIFFAGGDIGKLAVCGSCNDVAMRGARVLYLTLGLILEEGLSMEELKRVLTSIATQARLGGVHILSGDTKVLPRGAVDKIYINSTAIGELPKGHKIWSATHLCEGDEIIVSAPIGTHGAVIFCARNEIALQSELQSDCVQLAPLVECVRNMKIKTMRDATRGGVAAVLHEWARASCVDIEIIQERIPILEQVQGVCEILGLEALSLANEGVCVIVAAKGEGERILQSLRAHPLGMQASIIGRVSARCESPAQARVIMHNAYGGKRYVEYPQGELLPRIC